MGRAAINGLRRARRVGWGVGLTIVLALLGRPVQGQQYNPSQFQGFQQQQEEFRRQMEQAMRPANEWAASRMENDRRFQEQMAAGSKDIDAFFEKNWLDFTSAFTVFAVLGLVVVAVLALGIASGIVVRLRTTNDPMKLAMSDPWLRAHLTEASDASALAGLNRDEPFR
jgi:ABC-type transport system involved in cytochrome bd biosynthesis fused ATPase/permease subunit